MSSSHDSTCFEILAVLGEADWETITAVSDPPLSPDDLDILQDHEDVKVTNGRFSLTKSKASEIRSSLETENLAQYLHLHERAINYLVKQIQAGIQTFETPFLAVFERLSNRLLLDDPEQFIELAGVIQKVHLHSAIGQQRRDYYQGLALRKAERYIEAISVFTTLLAEPELDPHIQARTLNSRANCYRLIDRPEDALDGYEDSLSQWQTLGDRLNEGKVLLNMGIIAYDLQNYHIAEGCLQQATDIFFEIKSMPWWAIAQNELGLVYRDQGQWAAAMTCFEKLIAQRQTDDAQDHVGRGLENIGEIRLFQGRLDEAIVIFEQALEKMTTRVYKIDLYLHLGLTFQAKGNLTKAQALYFQALELAENIGRRNVLPHVHYRLGDVYRLLGDNMSALSHFETAAEVIEAAREPIQDEGLKISLFGRWHQIYEALVLHCLTMGDAARAFVWAEQARARAFSDIVQANHPPATFQLQNSSESQFETIQPTRIIIDDIQAVLPAGSAVLNFFTTGVLRRGIPLLQKISTQNPLRDHLIISARTLMFVVGSKKITVFECQINPNHLSISSPRGHDPHRLLDPDVMQKLYKSILAIAPDVHTANRLYIIPHGPLHHIPFAAVLHHKQKERPSFTGPTVVYAPSATLLFHNLLSERVQPNTESCLAVGYNSLSSERPLRYSEVEVTNIARIMHGESWVGSAPKKKALQKAAAQYHWLHFACHGWFNYDQPLASYLEIGQDECLTAHEILQTWRLKANLVILSACETGVSRILRGDEPMGLIRAFLYAGAKAVMVTQWQVEDLPTFLLMTRFYRLLQESKNGRLSEALYAAQQWLRTLPRDKIREFIAPLPVNVPEIEFPGNNQENTYPFSHPRHWAGFILVGDASLQSI